MREMPERFLTGDGLCSIAVGSGVMSLFPEALHASSFPRKLVVVSDRTVAASLFVPLKGVLEGAGFEIVAAFVPEGEHRKQLRSAEQLSSLLLEGAVGRGGGLLALGGGCVGDIAGYTAGTYLGGLPYVQLPTTLSSQVDSLARRRPALNHPQQKDLLAVDHAPGLVWIDLRNLDSLPRRERLSGLCALVAKAAGSSASLFDFVEKRIDGLVRFESGSVAEAVRGAARLAVCEPGDYGQGRSPVVRPGDIIGDALQLAGRFRSVRYGEARLLGLLAESRLAMELGTLAKGVHDHIVRIAEMIPFAAAVGKLKPWDVLRALKYDSKAMVRYGGIPLLHQVGEAASPTEIDDGRLTEAFRWTLEWAGRASSTN